MRTTELTTLNGGINRLRVKGGASARSLYDLLNGYITSDGGIEQREGTIRAQTLTALTVGLCAYKSVFNVFATALQTVPSGYQCNLLIHPTDSTQTLVKIWFAQPFMGFLYVVPQFSNGDIFHYWLQSTGVWAANTVYFNGNIVTPLASPNGLAYLATRQAAPNSTWQPQATISANNIIEPTEYNGFMYKAITVLGTSPHTGSTEPSWPITVGATIQEFGDFDTNTGDSGTVDTDTTVPLSSTITDRYGDSADVASSGTTTSGTAATVTAAAVVTTWNTGTLYAPGAVVQPSTNQGAFIGAIPNGDFESGNTGWSLDSGWSITSSLPYQGTNNLLFSHTGAGNFYATMTTYGVVVPGQSVTASCYAEGDSNGAIYIILRWYDASDTHLSDTMSTQHSGGSGTNPGAYSLIQVTGNAPSGAAHCRAAVLYTTGSGSARAGRADLVVWNLETPAAVSNFLYEAVQTSPGVSGSAEPTWPTVSGNTVIDNQVTWKAIGTSIITWQAIPIMESGGTEPTWPTVIGGSVSDGTMSWTATNRQITDSKCPNTKAVALAASHVFAGDTDICDYSAAVDPTDWSSANNAGYLPTGLNNYGANAIAVLALYRSNLMAFNAGGYQMWQVDPDPANMALLDAEPVGSIWPRAAQSVANDLLFLTEVGVRNITTNGASANMQVGSTGQPVDPIVVAQLKAATYDPLSLYYPGRGQYWLIFGPQCFVMTINGNNQKTWSRFVFPDSITDWTLSSGILYLRSAGNKVWQLDASTEVDDYGTTANGLVSLGTITPGTLYTAGTYLGVALTGGSGTGATANITVAAGAVTAVAIASPGTGYVAGDALSATAATLGGTGSGFSVPVAHTGVWFSGVIQWPYLDSRSLGVNNMMGGLDIIGAGMVNIQIGFDETDPTTFSDNAGFSTSAGVTPPYFISSADTLPGQPIPFPLNAPSVSVIFTFQGNQNWNWQAANMYMVDQTGGGFTG